jgi:hypothetical protein
MGRLFLDDQDSGTNAPYIIAMIRSQLGLAGCIVTRNNVKHFTFTVCNELSSLQHVLVLERDFLAFGSFFQGF